MEARLTVGIPVYNEEKYLSQTLESLINQKMEDWVAIISDNRSSDSSYEIAQYYSNLDSRITVYRHLNKIPAFENFKSTLHQAKTKYFVWLSGHDLFTEEYFKSALDIFGKYKNIAMVYPKSVLIDVDNASIGSANSDIYTFGMSRRNRMAIVAENLCYCTAIHGVFCTNILLQTPFKKIVGADQLLLFAAAYYGEFYELPFIGIERRKIRNETPEEVKGRWKKEGIFSESKHDVKSRAFLAVEHMKFVANATYLHLFEKILLILDIKTIFRRRYGISLLDTLKAFYYQNDNVL